MMNAARLNRAAGIRYHTCPSNGMMLRSKTSKYINVIFAAAHRAFQIDRSEYKRKNREEQEILYEKKNDRKQHLFFRK